MNFKFLSRITNARARLWEDLVRLRTVFSPVAFTTYPKIRFFLPPDTL